MHLLHKKNSAAHSILSRPFGRPNVLAPFPRVMVVIAVSGGCDSMLLTKLMSQYMDKDKLLALTVDHCVRAGSDKEAEEVGKIVSSWGE